MPICTRTFLRPLRGQRKCWRPALSSNRSNMRNPLFSLVLVPGVVAPQAMIPLMVILLGNQMTIGKRGKLGCRSWNGPRGLPLFRGFGWEAGGIVEPPVFLFRFGGLPEWLRPPSPEDSPGSSHAAASAIALLYSLQSKCKQDLNQRCFSKSFPCSDKNSALLPGAPPMAN